MSNCGVTASVIWTAIPIEKLLSGRAFLSRFIDAQSVKFN